MIAFVLSVIAASIIPAVTRKFSSSRLSTYFTTPPAYWMMSLYETQYGTGSTTSSPCSISTSIALKSASLPPVVNTHSSACVIRPKILAMPRADRLAHVPAFPRLRYTA